ncbi:MAG: PLP-dependent aspartate aminotransferase family protein [Oscillospiraceae bacterium]|nr:PLP-dependent aspartate aminotransferase family protein [Oscillospiraceae bacterium]
MIDPSSPCCARRADTKAVQGYVDRSQSFRPVSYPIYQTTTYVNPGLGSEIDYSYSRCSNPTRTQLENTAALLEGGMAAYAFSSGLAAEDALFSILEQGSHVVMGNDVYGGTYRQTMEYWRRFGLEFTFADATDPGRIERACRPNTRMIYVETPTNPMMKVADIAALSAVARAKGLLLTVDNTFLTPYFQRPIDFGADIVIHSATKYLAGHNDTIAGLAVVKDEALAARFDFMARTLGSALSPMDSWLTLRGIKTLALRMERHQSNALAAAEFLRGHKKVAEVLYAGLPDHPGYEISRRQSTGFGGMLSLTLKDASDVGKMLSGGRMIMFAESLGGVETLITYPKTQTHASIPPELCEELGITEKLVRLSVGIENPADIIEDLDRMLG